MRWSKFSSIIPENVIEGIGGRRDTRRFAYDAHVESVGWTLAMNFISLKCIELCRRPRLCDFISSLGVGMKHFHYFR
jgi:hypothetical protein